MHRRQLLTVSAAIATETAFAAPATAGPAKDESQASFATVTVLMGAVGGGDMDSMAALLMADELVWQNEGEPDLQWNSI